MKHSWPLSLVATLLVAFTFLISGCGGGSKAGSSVSQETSVRLDILARFYDDYMTDNRGKTPQDMEAFREYLESQTESLERYKERGLVESLDVLLTSARDEQPFTFLFGKLVEVPDWPGAYYMAHEQTGVEGKRMAARVQGGADLIDEQQFAEIFK